jgi:uncharacterized membrane protein YheB (UPF0754 family)
MDNEYNVTLKEATQQILKALGLEDNFDNHEKIYRPLLEKVNRGEIKSIKRGYRKNFIRQKDVDKYIEELKKTNRELVKEEVVYNHEIVENIRGLLRLYDNRILDLEAFYKGVREAVNKIS